MDGPLINQKYQRLTSSSDSLPLVPGPRPLTSCPSTLDPQPSTLPQLSVVLSFWNEEAVLPELIRRLRTVLGAMIATQQLGRYELIFVNDASTDRSEEVLREAAFGADDLRIINMSRNFGVAPCVMAGMQYASGDAVVYMDADLQDPPEVIPELVRVWKADPEVQVVHTVRRLRLGESALKRCVTWLGYLVLRSVSAIDLPHEAGDFKLLSRRVVEHLVQLQEQRPFTRGLVCWLGFKQQIVYYDREPRFAGKTKFPVLGWKVIRNFLDSAVMSFSDWPLKLAGFLGLGLAGLAMLYPPWALREWSAGREIPGWSVTCFAVVLLGGIQLLSVGILGNYVSAVFFESKRRPNYIVKSTAGFEKQGKSLPHRSMGTKAD
jgi:glycosyltransferase involved in cell wall biosynthesis